LRYHCSPYHTNSALHPVTKQLERAAGFRPDDSERLAKVAGLEAVHAETGQSFVEIRAERACATVEASDEKVAR
jgi:hypothetical protein